MGPMTVNEIARRTGVPSHTVRYYTRIGLLRPARRRDNGYKEFTTLELQRLHFIRSAQRLGLTLSEIREVIARAARGDSPCPMVREILSRRLIENQRSLQELATLVQRMDTALEQWAGMQDGVPDGHAVCRLIESFSEP
jgi:MerR family Zn(II)-responsive transcriptional regulator of zntA